MAASKVGICNLALSHLGIGKEIATFDTERSEEAAACRRFYDQALEQTLRDFAWPFATRTAELALVEEEPTSEWAYSYRYPANCVLVRRIPSGTRNETRQSKTPYRVASDATGRLIYTDKEDAEVEYTYNVVDPSLYPIDFVMALSLRLAVYIAPRITKGDPFKLRNETLSLYNYEISKAQAGSGNEEQPEEEPESEFVRARNE